MEEKVARYYELKQAQKEIEGEMEHLRKELLNYYTEGTSEEFTEYNIKISFQERKEYDDAALYNALPDASLWRLLSKADGSKIASLIKLNVINEEILKDTYKVKQVPYIQVSKK